MTDVVVVAMVLNKRARDPVTMERVQAIAEDLGLTPTSMGKATLSFRVSPAVFEQLFGQRPHRLSPLPPNDTHLGAPGGYALESELPLPPQLADYVEHISVVPPARRVR